MTRVETMVNESPVTVNVLVSEAMARALCIKDSCSGSIKSQEDIAISLLQAAIDKIKQS